MSSTYKVVSPEFPITFNGREIDLIHFEYTVPDQNENTKKFPKDRLYPREIDLLQQMGIRISSPLDSEGWIVLGTCRPDSGGEIEVSVVLKGCRMWRAKITNIDGETTILESTEELRNMMRIWVLFARGTIGISVERR